jgi:outer membrane murein-binding lipoprotein Lpp
MKYDVLHNFISPVTGRILVDTDYTIVGNGNGVGIPSPILIDIQLDIIEIRTNYNTLRQASFVIGEQNDQLPYAQVLNTMGNGYIYSTDGVVRTDDVILLDHLTELQDTYVWVGGTVEVPVEGGEEGETTTIHNRPIPVPHIELNNLPNLTEGNLWMGDGDGRPQETVTITIDNLPALPTAEAVENPIIAPDACFWLSDGGIEGRPQVTLFVEAVTEVALEVIADAAGEFYAIPNAVNFLSIGLTGLAVNSNASELDIQILNNAVGELAIDIARLNEDTAELRIDIDAISDTVTRLDSNVAELNYVVLGLFSNVIELNAYICQISNTINNLRLNNISADGNVSLYNYRIIDLADPIDPQDGATKAYVDSAVTGSAGSLTIEGFVVGGPPVDNVITTTRGPTCLLTNIPAGGDVSMDNYRVTNLKQSPEGDFDAVSFKFLWDLMHDEVEILWP